METDYPPFVHNDQGERSASIIQIDNGKALAVTSICSAFCAISAVVACWAAFTAKDATTEYRVVLNHTMEMEAKQKVLIDELEELKHGHR